uniref:4-hydroxybenzoate polyprenyltransferase, mitochondrial n=1 Tax=Cajanus cajan TaxID=3821 RepID=A0A151U105_CAJCA|nr:hypothetical protein KK1_005606 [Cajanus cajan]
MASSLILRASRRFVKPAYAASLLIPTQQFVSQSPTTPSPPFKPTQLQNFNFEFRKSVGCVSNFHLVAYLSTSPSKEDNKQSGNVSSSGAGDTSWIDLYLPRQVQPYARLARLDKPIGTWLLLWPCMWSISLAATPGQLPDFKMMALFGCGALLLRGAGCTVNDLLDRDIDTMYFFLSALILIGDIEIVILCCKLIVERTKLRPVASGLLTPFQGLCFLGFQLLLGLGILLQLNNYRKLTTPNTFDIFIGLNTPYFGCLILVARLLISSHEEVYILGWAAVKGSLDPSVVLPLYASGVFWTLVYDTIYAHQDKEDDLKVGVKSTALRFGDSTKEWISGFGIACLGGLAVSGFNAEIVGWPYYASLAAASGHLGWQIWTVDLSSRADCNRKFVSNKWFGAIIFGGILAGRLSS